MPKQDLWFTTWIDALSKDKTTIHAHDAGTIVAYGDADLVMLDAAGQAVAIVAM